MDWTENALREDSRYREGEDRLPGVENGDARQRQLARMGNAAAGAGLAWLMKGDTAVAGEWFARAVERYRESYPLAPAGSWGRPIAILKARILAGDWTGAEADAAWTLDEGAAESESPIGLYAAALALLVLGRDQEARAPADLLRTNAAFSAPVGDALAFLVAGDPIGYVGAIERVLESFEDRDDYLEDLPVADTVMVLQALAARRGLAAELSSPLLP
jgi:hypothetical protein